MEKGSLSFNTNLIIARMRYGGSNMKYKYIIPVICLLALFASTSHALRPGDAAPDILGRLTTGKKFKLSNYSGKIRVVNFFTMNCPPCKKE